MYNKYSLAILSIHFITQHPGPWGLPILGYALFVNKKQQYKTYDDLYKRYGPVVGVNFGMHYVVLVNGWKAVQESLLSDNLSYRPRYLVSPELYPGEQKGIHFTNLVIFSTSY